MVLRSDTITPRSIILCIHVHTCPHTCLLGVDTLIHRCRLQNPYGPPTPQGAYYATTLPHYVTVCAPLHTIHGGLTYTYTLT